MTQKTSPILRIMGLPVSFILISLGISTILGGHITPGGGFQGGAMIASGIILNILIYGLNDSPINLSHDFIATVESLSALLFVLFGLIGLLIGGSFLYNIGSDFYNLVPNNIENIFHYPDLTNAGIIPYLNIFVGLKVLVGLSAVAFAFLGFKKIEES